MSPATAFAIARREFVGGFSSFAIYLACLALGAFAIAASGSATESFKRGLDAQSRLLLGGDGAFTAAQRRASDAERAFMDARGTTSETVELNLMGEALVDGEKVRAQVSLRGVDASFPLLGAAALSGAETDATLQDVLAERGGRWGVAASASLLERFGIEVGDAIDLGPVKGRVAARLDREPDGLGAAGTFGPSAIVAIDGLVEAGRLTNGQLFRATYLLAFDRGVSGDDVAEAAKAEFGPAGLSYRAPVDAVDGLGDLLDLLTSFLAVVGVAALVAGGVGVAQAAGAFLESRTDAIAALKAFGADAAGVRLVYGFQLGALALTGAAAGGFLGALAPLALDVFVGERIPLPQALGFYPGPVFRAIVLSSLAAVMFAAPALGRARATSPAALFRSEADDCPSRAPQAEALAALVAALALVALAVFWSPRPAATAALLAGAGGAFLVLRGAAALTRRLARGAIAGTSGVGRIAVANLAGPGSLAPTTAPALGLGLALLTLVAAVQSNLLRQISQTAPQEAPSLVFSQIPDAETDLFDATLRAHGVAINDPEAYRRAPFMLGRVIELDGAPIDRDEVAPSERWVVDGEVALTYVAGQPPEASLTAGDWWPADYDGPLLASVEADAAKGLGLDVGSRVGFRIFGREIEARVASLREVDWGGFGVNSAFILSPGELEAAAPRHFAIAMAPLDAEVPIIKSLGEALPEVVVFQTRGALAAAARIFANVGLAVNAAAGVVTLAGLLVLAGALAAIVRKRRTEAALLKCFGATRGRVLALYAAEFGAAGGVAAILGVAMGLAGAYPVVTQVFEAQWALPVGPVLTIAVVACLVASAGGAAVGAALLSERPAPALKAA